jgi:CheY-like chemotaxis protein
MVAHKVSNPMRYHRILFVEDDLFSNMENCEFLRGNSFNVSSTYCAHAALELLAKDGQWSALVTDIDLGAGADGFDVARRARIGRPQLPIIFVSGRAGVRDLSANIPGSEFIAKPFHPRQIVAALHRALPAAAA